jgi:hypothetical protein
MVLSGLMSGRGLLSGLQMATLFCFHMTEKEEQSLTSPLIRALITSTRTPPS